MKERLTEQKEWVLVNLDLRVGHLHVELLAESSFESHLEVLLLLFQAAAEKSHERPHSGDVGSFQGVSALDDSSRKVNLIKPRQM